MTDEASTHISPGPEEAKFMMRIREAIAAVVLADNLLRQKLRSIFSGATLTHQVIQPDVRFSGYEAG